MNLRHAAALSLLAGWVLIEPPVFIPPPSDNPPPADANLDAPPSKWTISGRFDKLDDCRKARQKIIDDLAQGQFPFDMPQNMSKENLDASRANISFAAGVGQCVDATAPMFKNKPPADSGSTKSSGS